MSEIQTVEQKQLIADRVPPGDRWALTADPAKSVYESLTDTLEAFPAKASLAAQVNKTGTEAAAEVKTADDFRKLSLEAQLQFKATQPEAYKSLFTQN